MNPSSPSRRERRRYPRAPADTAGPHPLRLPTGDSLELINIGRGGALVESRVRLLPGRVVVVHTVILERRVSIRAHVLRCTVSAIDALAGSGVRYRGALRFEDSEQAGTLLRGWLDPLVKRESV